jgi:predicted GIY-YIG superfamily endonuclease
MAKRKHRASRRKREPLVQEHLERVSRDLLDDHPEVVKEFIGRNTGIYALYRKDKLYYVGLATKLRSRLAAHGKNQHGKLWDRFSIYLTIKDQHLREIEALILRITQPKGKKQKGKLAQSRDMRRRIARRIRERQAREVSSLFGRQIAAARAPKRSGVNAALVRLLPQGGRLRAIYKGKTYKARVRRDGRVRFAGSTYRPLSLAGHAVTRRPTNGWHFWDVERSRGNWVRMNKIRRVGTPVYLR